MYQPDKSKFVEVLPEAFAPKPMNEVQKIRALLETYPVDYFYMSGWRKFRATLPGDREDAIHGNGWAVCATCIIGYVAARKGKRFPVEESDYVRSALRDAGAKTDQISPLIMWEDLRKPFSEYSSRRVPKAVLLEAFDRVVRGEKITA